MKPGGDIEIFTALCLLSDAVVAVIDSRPGTRRHDRAMARLAKAQSTVGPIMLDAPLRLEALDEGEWRRRVRLLNSHAQEVRRRWDDKTAAEACR